MMTEAVRSLADTDKIGIIGGRGPAREGATLRRSLRSHAGPTGCILSILPAHFVLSKKCGDSDPSRDAVQKKGRAEPGRKVFRRGCLKGTAFVHRTTP